MRTRPYSFTSTFVLSAVLPLILASLLPSRATAECFDPAVEVGAAYADKQGNSLLVLQVQEPSGKEKFGNTVVGVGVRGAYFGCKISEAQVSPLLTKAKKFNLFLPLPNAPVKGFELDISTETRRIIAARSISVPWEVVDRSKGLTATCARSNSTAFEGFLYTVLRAAKARRCTEAEIKTLVGDAAYKYP